MSTTMEPTPLQSFEATPMGYVLSLVLGGGGTAAIWAYMAKRRESDADRLARFETRLDSRLAKLEEEDEKKSARILDLSNKLAIAETQIKDIASERDTLLGVVGQLREQNRILRGKLRGYGEEISEADDAPSGAAKVGP